MPVAGALVVALALVPTLPLGFAPPDRALVSPGTSSSSSGAATLTLNAPPVARAAWAEGLRDALALRLPDVTLLDGPHNPETLRIDVAQTTDPNGAAIAVIVMRAGDEVWTRRLPLHAPATTQTIASAIAVLVEARLGIPGAAPLPLPDLPESKAEPKPKPEPAAAEPKVAPRVRDPPASKTSPANWAAMALVRAAVPIAARGPTRLRGFAGSLVGTAEHHKGALIYVGARVLARNYVEQVTLIRLRLAVGAGYRLHHKRWQFGFAGAVAVEPFWVLAARQPAIVRRGRQQVRPPPLVGPVASLSAHRLIRWPARPGLALVLGPRLELSTLLSPDGGVVLLSHARARDDRRTLGSVGGAEFSVGVDVGLVFGRP